MYNIILFVKTSEFYIKVIEEFLKNFNILLIVINKKSDYNSYFNNFINNNKLKYLVHPYKKNIIETKKFINNLKYYDIDYIFTIYYPQILTKEIINLAKFNSFNFHPGRLPDQRGAHILNWLIIKNITDSCVTLHKLNEDIDAGKILHEEKYVINYEDTINDIIEKTNDKALIIIKKLNNFLNYGKENLYENDGINIYYKPRNIDDSEINFEKDSLLEIYNKNRALVHPYPGIFWFKNGIKFNNNKFLNIFQLNNLIQNEINQN